MWAKGQAGRGAQRGGEARGGGETDVKNLRPGLCLTSNRGMVRKGHGAEDQKPIKWVLISAGRQAGGTGPILASFETAWPMADVLGGGDGFGRPMKI